MHRLRIFSLLCAASVLVIGSSLWAASPVEPLPADRAADEPVAVSDLGDKAEPGDYVLQIYARPDKDSQVFIRGIEGGDRALKVPSSGEIVAATVTVGAKPVSLETGTGFYGALCWMAMVRADDPKP